MLKSFIKIYHGKRDGPCNHFLMSYSRKILKFWPLFTRNLLSLDNIHAENCLGLPNAKLTSLALWFTEP